MSSESEPLELEIQIHRRGSKRFAVDLAFFNPATKALVRPLDKTVVIMTIDQEELKAAQNDARVYGELLGAMLFEHAPLRTAFAACRTAAATQGVALRVMIAISTDALDLHTLRWETIIVPGDALPLALSTSLRFSRLLGSADWQPVGLRAKALLRALVVIAAPPGLDPERFAPIDPAAEQERAEHCLGKARKTFLAAPGLASLNRIRAELQRGFDILYVVAHGVIVDEEPWLLLDDGEGAPTPVNAHTFAALVRELNVRPQLAFLASCQSAGDGSADALVALGPRLVSEGLPAAIGMQGSISLATHAAFAEAFFRELGQDGRLDRALAAARQEVAQKDDWWMPVLFTRLRGDRIWYEPGFESGDTFKHWLLLLAHIEQGRCTPILGPGLLDGYIGSSRLIAQKLAERHGFPLAPLARDDLPQVTQFLAVRQDNAFMLDQLAAAFRDALAETIEAGPVSPNEAAAYLARAGRARRAADPGEPYRILAELPFTIYLTATPDTLLVDALVDAKRDPQVVYCPWDADSFPDQQEIVPPSKERPLVCYLFGRLDEPERLVMTEDDYFRYLIGFTRNRDLIPGPIGRALTNSALLFLGFGLEDWNFRVLFQSLMHHSQSAKLRNRFVHIAVQVSPQEGRMINPGEAREYLKLYFGEQTAASYNTRFSVYWGSAEDFIRDLVAQRGSVQAEP